MIPELLTALRKPSHLLVIGLLITTIVLHYTGSEAVLSYQRSLIANGSWWLLLSGNFVHLGSTHLWMNLAGLALVAALVWPHFSALQWSILIVLCSVGVGLGLWFFNPEVEGYVGFSGTLHGLIIAGALADLRVYPRTASVLLLCVVAKLVWEQFAGALPGSESVAGGKVLVDAHLYGAIVGALIAPPILLLQRYQAIHKH